MSVRDLAELAGLDRDRLYQGIDRVTSKLCGTVVRLRRPNNDGFLKSSLFSTAEYIASEEIVNFKINPDLIPYLLRSKTPVVVYPVLSRTNELPSVQTLVTAIRATAPVLTAEKGQGRRAD